MSIEKIKKDLREIRRELDLLYKEDSLLRWMLLVTIWGTLGFFPIMFFKVQPHLILIYVGIISSVIAVLQILLIRIRKKL